MSKKSINMAEGTVNSSQAISALSKEKIRMKATRYQRDYLTIKRQELARYVGLSVLRAGRRAPSLQEEDCRHGGRVSEA